MTQYEKDKLFIDIAKRVSQESKCISLHVGACLVHDSRIISIGYNGTPAGYPNCLDAFSDNKFDRAGHHEWSIQHEIHAEMNALLFAAKEGIPTAGCTMYVTHEPCDNCMKNMIAAGITRIVYLNECHTTSHGDTFCPDFRQGFNNISVEKFNQV